MTNSSDRVAFDRVTPPPCTAMSADRTKTRTARPTSTVTPRSSTTGLGYKFPIDTEKKTYPFFDTVVGKSFPMVYKGTEKKGGLDCYKFVQMIRTSPCTRTACSRRRTRTSARSGSSPRRASSSRVGGPQPGPDRSGDARPVAARCATRPSPGSMALQGLLTFTDPHDQVPGQTGHGQPAQDPRGTAVDPRSVPLVLGLHRGVARSAGATGTVRVPRGSSVERHTEAPASPADVQLLPQLSALAQDLSQPKIAVPGISRPRSGLQPPHSWSFPSGHSGSTRSTSTQPGGDRARGPGRRACGGARRRCTCPAASSSTYGVRSKYERRHGQARRPRVVREAPSASGGSPRRPSARRAAAPGRPRA